MIKPTSIEAAPEDELDVDGFSIHRLTRQVVFAVQTATVRARALDLLLALVERRERTVSKTELLDLVRPGLVVEK